MARPNDPQQFRQRLEHMVYSVGWQLVEVPHLTAAELIVNARGQGLLLVPAGLTAAEFSMRVGGEVMRLLVEECQPDSLAAVLRVVAHARAGRILREADAGYTAHQEVRADGG